RDPPRHLGAGPARRAAHAPLRDVPAAAGAARGPAREGQARLAVPHGGPDGRGRAGRGHRHRAQRGPSRAHHLPDHRGGPGGARRADPHAAGRAGQRVPAVPGRARRGAQPPPRGGGGAAADAHAPDRGRGRPVRRAAAVGRRTGCAGGVPARHPLPARTAQNRAELAHRPHRSARTRGAAVAERGRAVTGASPWPALWALSIGFFMILVDATIVSVATPAIMTDLGADVASVVWVTSAYLLAYAVPLLVTGRLGDRFGPKQVYLVGLVIFTLASLWCGLTTTVEQLILARIVQGLGAALMNPQTMAVITRTFPADRRGRALRLRAEERRVGIA